jgi:hypothetical protein
MIDSGLLVSVIIVVATGTLVLAPWPEAAVAGGVLDAALGALVAGVIAGRLAFVALDDPSSLTSVADLLVIRSGVEFWPGVAVGIAWASHLARRDGVRPLLRLAALAPSALVAWSAYEASCLLRDGCFGPRASIGLRPRGFATPMLPIGLVVGALVLGAAVGIRQLHRHGWSPWSVVVSSVSAIALVRSVASIWLPRIGSSLSRQHVTSIVVAAATMAAALLTRVVHDRISQRAQRSTQ